MNHDAHLESIWQALFRRRGGSAPDAGLWDDRDDIQRARALAGITLEPDELPVFASLVPNAPPLLLTTRRLVSGSAQVAIKAISWADPVGFPAIRKQQLTDLRITTSDGTSPLHIRVAPGAPYIGIWSILLQIAKANKHAATAARPS